jgi:biopolymer transport protein ExbD
MRISSGYEHKRPRVEMMPLIDVVFLLLVFFIYTMLSMTVYRGVKVNLPAGYGAEKKPEAFVITITEAGNVYIGDDQVNVEQAVARARNAVRKEDLPVVVMGDRNSNLGTSVELLSGLRRAEVNTVAFQVQEKQ